MKRFTGKLIFYVIYHKIYIFMIKMTDEFTHQRISIMIDPNDIEAEAYFMYNDISIHFDKTKPIHEFIDMISPYIEKYNVEKAIDKLD